ncbi:alpha-2-macroglobulin-like protein 1 [Xenopus laevis]|uniref:Alpha-2-macroglobulin-like protein 1 n=1 Tax=Xenopus laevis TaxID=8355 RepID=A0A8J1LBQ3_XENLA|nr:alpha-2-macroglobulin-like protein 1 [Xenopus laevis]
MKVLLISFCLSILGLGAPETSQPHYLITVPAQLMHPSKEEACVTLLQLKGAVSLRMELHRNDHHQVVADDKITTESFLHCYSFQVPAAEEDREVWFFHVSAEGDNININQTKKILILEQKHITIIQTDKSLYKPGQTVNFRAVTLDMDFHAQNDKYPLVELKDPNDNRIGQWLNVVPTQGIADFSFRLAEEVPVGEYRIHIPSFAYGNQHFIVAEYELKRFKVYINAQEKVSPNDDSFHLEVCGSYTYGKPVQGIMNITINPLDIPWWDIFYGNIDSEQTGEHVTMEGGHTDDRGCFTKEIDLHPFNVSSNHQLKVVIHASLTEDGTDKEESESHVLQFMVPQYLQFVDLDSYYQKGIPLTGMMKVSTFGMESRQNAEVYLVVNVDEVDTNITLVTDENGIARFTLDTSEWNDMVSLTGKISLEDGEDQSMALNWLFPFYSESNSFIKVQTIGEDLLCSTKQSVSVEYIIDRKELDPKSDHLSFFYILMSKRAIITSREYKLDVQNLPSDPILHGSFNITFSVNMNLVPTATLLVYAIFPDGEVAADRARYNVPVCFDNKVQMEFTENNVSPGGNVNLDIKADPGSLCSVRSVDKGLSLLTEKETYELLPMVMRRYDYTFEISKRGFPYTIEDFEAYPCLEGEPVPLNRAKRSLKRAPWYQSEADVYSLFKSSSLKVFTNTRIRKPVTCALPEYTRRYSIKDGVDVADRKLDSPSREPASKEHPVRKFFPETWLYDLVSVGPQGKKSMNLTTPDSITEWVTDAFCVGNSGFGEVHNVGLKTFQPYFIDLLLPYSVVKEEEFPLKVLVFNYLDHCVLVDVALTIPPDFGEPRTDLEKSSCICGQETAGFTWSITASKLGSIPFKVTSRALQVEGKCSTSDIVLNPENKFKHDAIQKTILVKPSGVEVDKTQTSLLCPTDDSVREEVSLQLPEDLEQGSEHAHITVLGDVMGNSISNMGDLLQLPFGCGEQNIAKFAPNIYILEYLESANALTPEIKDKALNYLTTGYQRQLLSKHDNGSYSAFGKKDEEGNTWLTAMVVRSFSKAQKTIYIDEKHIQEAIKWLGSYQLDNGCFRSVGKLFNNELKSGVDDEVTISAYITIALLEHGTVHNSGLVENALKCLKDAANNVNNTYSQAILAYAFTLSGDKDLRQHMLDNLEKYVTDEDGSKHWSEGSSGGVEISSYVLLALLSGDEVTKKDLKFSSDITNWVIKQQNFRGGFHSTQDTVVAIHALSKYARATYREKRDVTLTVRCALTGYQTQFRSDDSNRILLQRAPLPDIPGKYTITATGTGCVYVQTHLKYHIHPAESFQHFTLNVTTQPNFCTAQAQKSFEIHVAVRYSGNRAMTNMAIIEVHHLSGFAPVARSLKLLEQNENVKRTEVTDEKVSIYLEELTHKTETFSFVVKQETPVSNLQPANVIVYDYYDPREHAAAEYHTPCAGNKETKEQ